MDFSENARKVFNVHVRTCYWWHNYDRVSGVSCKSCEMSFVIRENFVSSCCSLSVECKLLHENSHIYHGKAGCKLEIFFATKECDPCCRNLNVRSTRRQLLRVLAKTVDTNW